MLAMAKPPSFSDLRSLASLAEQRGQPTSKATHTPMGMQQGMVGYAPTLNAGPGRAQRVVPQPKTAPPPRGPQPETLQDLAVATDGTQSTSPDTGAQDNGKTGRKGGRATLTEEQRRERRLLSNRLAAKRSYYRRQNRQSNIKQAIDQIQTELKNARSKVALFKQVLRDAGLDPEAILANTNVPAAAATAMNSLPPSAQQQMPPQPQQQLVPQQPPAPPRPQQRLLQQQQQPPPAAQQFRTMANPHAGMLITKHSDGGHTTPPNTYSMPGPAATQMMYARPVST